MKNLKYAKVVDLLKIEENYSNLIKHCDICKGIIIDHDKVPQDIIIDYDDRRINSELLTCEICKASICRNCATLIEDTWDVFYLCPNCINNNKKLIERIKILQNKSIKILNKLEESLYKLRNNCSNKFKTRRLNGRNTTSK